MLPYPFISCVLFASSFTFASIDAQRQLGQCCEEYCYDRDAEKLQSGRFATKTAYQMNKGSDSRRQSVVPNCSPVKFWFLSRHGTRLPGSDDIPYLKELVKLRDEVVDNYEKRLTKPDYGALCDEDVEILKNWNWDPNITEEYSHALTAQGSQDLLFLAKHYQSVFPNVLEDIYTPEKFRFRHTHTQLTWASYKAFADGLFGEGVSDHIQILPETKPDLLLNPYGSCKAYKDNAARQTGPDSEYVKFGNSDAYKQVVYEVSTRLGFKFLLTPKQITAMWDMCRYDLAWNLDRTSPWCIAFTPNHVKVLEYHEDLSYYYKNGYNSSLNNNLACSLVVDMLNHLERQTMPKVVAYFGHSAILQLLLTALGVVKDNETLRADNYQQLMHRKWRSSEVCPFAANLAVIKFDCPHDNERNKIMFFLNQKPLDFDWCNVGLCDWSKVQQMYSSFKQRDCLTTHCITEANAASNVRVFTVIVFALAGSILLLIVLIHRRPRPLVILTFRLQRLFGMNRNQNYSHTGT